MRAALAKFMRRVNADPDARDLWIVVTACLATSAAVIAFAMWAAVEQHRSLRAPFLPRATQQLPETADESAESEPAGAEEDMAPFEENPCGGKAEMARITARDRAARERAERDNHPAPARQP